MSSETQRAYDANHCDSCFIFIPCGYSWVTPAAVLRAGREEATYDRCPDCGWPIPTGECGRCLNEQREIVAAIDRAEVNGREAENEQPLAP